ncbi:MAG: T9SS type A sorting domain-containing protein [Bacteroidales bacterium]|nr:T9SS type A sorting domain-containing protein [Bacteroidales bacterium]
MTENGLHEVIIKVDSDLLSSLTEPIVPASESRIGSISPNPFSSYTRIAFSLDNSAKTSLVVYNIQGQVIKILTNREFSAGNHELNWDGKDESGSEVSSGIYLLKLETERGVDFRKLILSE